MQVPVAVPVALPYNKYFKAGEHLRCMKLQVTLGQTLRHYNNTNTLLTPQTP